MSISCTLQIALIHIHFIEFNSTRYLQFFDLYNACGEWPGIKSTAADDSADRAI